MPLPADGKKVKLGKGSLLLDKLSPAGLGTGFDFTGNVTALEISADVTKAELFSSTERSAPKIAEAITRVGFTLNATCSEYTLRNLEKFLLGTANDKDQPVGVGTTVAIDGEGVFPGRYYDTGSRKITNVVVTRDGSDIAVLNTDYLVNSEFGLIKVVEGGAIQAGDDLSIQFDRPAATIKQVRIARDAAPVCHLLFLADDANQDGDAAHDRLEIWRVSLAPEGALNFISDEFGNFQLTMGVLSDSENHPDDPFGTLDRIEV